MKAKALSISDVVLFEPEVFKDDRGFFFESYNQKIFEEAIGSPFVFVQDNHSQSKKGVLRGLHYQLKPQAQGKLVKVVQGEIFDVAVDIRKNSANFGNWVGEILSEKNKKQLWIPEGFAHGFLTLSQKAQVLYKVTDFYNQKLERCLHWKDPQIAIDWPIETEVFLSKKDLHACFLSEADLFD